MAATGIVLFCEAGKGQTESANERLVAAGLELAEHTGGKVSCLLAGHGITHKAAELAKYVDEVWLADSPAYANYNPPAYLGLARKLVADKQARVVLFGHTHLGMDLAPRLGLKLKVGVASNCFDVRIESGAICCTRPMYKARIHAKVALPFEPAIATLQLGGSASLRADRGGVVLGIDLVPEQDRRMRPVRTIEPVREGVDITKSDIVVSGGRGIGAQDNYALVRELAEVLGGAAACSRPLVDMGWLTANHQVGLSGNTVKPKLYIACGISGAVEHLQGMKESGMIVAINNDPQAPILRIAHCAVLGDVNEILPELIKEVRAKRSGCAGSAQAT